jgi:hypothetical protein
MVKALILKTSNKRALGQRSLNAFIAACQRKEGVYVGADAV